MLTKCALGLLATADGLQLGVGTLTNGETNGGSTAVVKSHESLPFTNGETNGGITAVGKEKIGRRFVDVVNARQATRADARALSKRLKWVREMRGCSSSAFALDKKREQASVPENPSVPESPLADAGKLNKSFADLAVAGGALSYGYGT